MTTIVNRSILPGRDLCDVTDGSHSVFSRFDRQPLNALRSRLAEFSRPHESFSCLNWHPAVSQELNNRMIN